ncbi:MAG TPA: hypothetical protein VH877_06115 [Polyangia bacterium]|jgi:hypothetical protein|nr:hypothetical protein [Polyangia bacterium]
MRTALAATCVEPLPLLFPGDISWRSLASGQVEFSVLVRNHHAAVTRPATLVFGVAPLGAFVPPYPIARLAVRGLLPGEQQLFTLRVAHGSLPAFPVEEDWRRKLALGGGGTRPPAPPQDERLQKMLQRLKGVVPPDLLDQMAARARGIPDPGLAGDPDLETSDSLAQLEADEKLMATNEWVGNVNIWFDHDPSSAVEVHLARGIQVTAGRGVALWLFLPYGHRYEVSLSCSNPAWHTELLNLQVKSTLVVRAPEQRGSRAIVVVYAMRLADRKIVPVEFTFEAVAGRSTALGCLAV